MDYTGLSNDELAWFAALSEEQQEQVFFRCQQYNQWWRAIPLIRQAHYYIEAVVYMGGWRWMLGAVFVLALVLGVWAWRVEVNPGIILLTAVIGIILGALLVFALHNRRRK